MACPLAGLAEIGPVFFWEGIPCLGKKVSFQHCLWSREGQGSHGMLSGRPGTSSLGASTWPFCRFPGWEQPGGKLSPPAKLASRTMGKAGRCWRSPCASGGASGTVAGQGICLHLGLRGDLSLAVAAPPAVRLVPKQPELQAAEVLQVGSPFPGAGRGLGQTWLGEAEAGAEHRLSGQPPSVWKRPCRARVSGLPVGAERSGGSGKSCRKGPHLGNSCRASATKSEGTRLEVAVPGR